MNKKPLKPYIRGGGFLPSDRWPPLVYPGGRTTPDKGNNAGEIVSENQNDQDEETNNADC